MEQRSGSRDHVQVDSTAVVCKKDDVTSHWMIYSSQNVPASRHDSFIIQHDIAHVAMSSARLSKLMGVEAPGMI